MVRRTVLGLVLGLLVGGLVAAGIVAGLQVLTFSGSGGTVLAYAAAALTGVLTGLVAGKPIWSSGAKVEAGLKAIFGALMGAGAMFALRQWAGAWVVPSFPAIGANGVTPVGELPAVSLPLLAAVLGGFFGADNTDDSARAGDAGKQRPGAKERKRVQTDGAGVGKSTEASMGAEGSRDSDDEAELVSRGRAKH
jgi:hypothetical protein